MDGRRRQRSIALNHIPQLPIRHGLDYPLGSRIHLGVLYPGLEPRGRPFPRSPRLRSRVKLRVLRPLTRGPQGQPSPLWTPNGRPGVQGIFPTSRGQAPHDWPMVHHSMATGFPIPGGCCSGFSATHRSLVRNPATSHSPLPHPVTHHGLLPASRVFLPPWGCCAALATLSSWSRPLFSSLIPCLYPTGPPATQCAQAHWILIHPGTASCALHGSLPSRPLFVWVGCFLLDLLGALLPGPAPASHGTRAYSAPGHLRFFFTLSRATRGPSSAPFAPTRSPAACWLCAVRPPAVHCGFDFFSFPFRLLPPALSLCASCVVVSLCFTLLPACTHVSTALVIGSRLPSVFVSGPLALAGPPSWRSPAKPGGRPSLASLCSLPSLLSPARPHRLSLVRPLTAAVLLRVLSAALPQARAVSRALSRASLPPPCPPSCRRNWAASPGTPFGGFARGLPLPSSPPSVP